jgi:hypothetical protein
MDLPVVIVKAVKQKFEPVEYSNAELLNIVFRIAEEVREEGETLEESLFQSSHHIIRECFPLGANTHYVGKAVFKHYKDTPHKLAAAVFRDYCTYSNAQIVNEAWFSLFEGINTSHKSRVMNAKSNKPHIERSKELRVDWDEWQADKSLYENQERFIEAMTQKHNLSDRAVKNWVRKFKTGVDPK